MDRIISKDEIQRTNRNKIFKYIGLTSFIIIFMYFILSLMKPTLSNNDILTAKSFRGSIEQTIFSIGTIIPNFEESIVSPIETKIKSVRKSVGTKVLKDESILELDKTIVSSEYEKLVDEYNLKLNKKSQLKLRLENELIDLKSQLEIKLLEIKSLKARKAQEEKLFNIGAGSKESFEVASLNLKISQRQKTLLDKKITNRQKSLEADLNELDLELKIQKRIIDETKNKLSQSDILSSINGVVTWVEETIGKRINPGDVVARVTQENSFKLRGELSESNASKMYIGQEIFFEVNGQKHYGKITSINPSVSNGVVTYFAKIPNSIDGLRSNLNIDTHLVLSKKEDAILIKTSMSYSGESILPMFIIEDGVAKKRMVETGISNYKYVELKSSIGVDETVIISNMEDYYHMNEIEIK